MTRRHRAKGATRIYTLQPTTRLPPQAVVLTVASNKKQLIDLILADFIEHKNDFTRRVVVTGADPAPVEINAGLNIRRQDIATGHEEADSIIIHQVINVPATNALVVADDTDIFVLLCHFLFLGVIKNHVLMTSPIRDRAVIDINRTVRNNFG